MRIFVLADALDVRGFALAGVEGACPENSDAARAHFTRVVDDPRPVGLLLVSERVAGLLTREVEKLVRSERPPAVLVLPGRRP
ncbi:MAG: V-type ATP synthase subunit F [Syntrophomonadaceae bacterium]